MPMQDADWQRSLRLVPGDTCAWVVRLGCGLLDLVVHHGPLMEEPLRFALPAEVAADFFGCIEAARRQLAAHDDSALTPGDDSRLRPSSRIARAFVHRRKRVPDWVGLLKSSYASETPVTDGERLFAYFGNVGVYCFEFDGREIWKHALGPHPMRFGWGTAASPVLHRDRLYLVNDNEEDSCLLALDTKTGKEVWRTSRDEKSNWATPYVWQHAQRTEIVTPGTGQVRSYDLDGKLIWWLTGMSSITIATPYQHDGLLYLSSGYVLDTLRPIYAIRPGASGG